MTDQQTNPGRPFAALLAAIDEVFNTGIVPTAEEAGALKESIAKLTDPGRGSTLDFGDPANLGLISLL